MNGYDMSEESRESRRPGKRRMDNDSKSKCLKRREPTIKDGNCLFDFDPAAVYTN